jgi:hypothetical protein
VNSKQALQIVRGLPGYESEAHKAFAALEADAQALADVRTLDVWAVSDSSLFWQVILTDSPAAESWLCSVQTEDACFKFRGPTPEGARAKAAEWVREQAAPTSEGLK